MPALGRRGHGVCTPAVAVTHCDCVELGGIPRPFLCGPQRGERHPWLCSESPKPLPGPREPRLRPDWGCRKGPSLGLWGPENVLEWEVHSELWNMGWGLQVSQGRSPSPEDVQVPFLSPGGGRTSHGPSGLAGQEARVGTPKEATEGWDMGCNAARSRSTARKTGGRLQVGLAEGVQRKSSQPAPVPGLPKHREQP